MRTHPRFLALPFAVLLTVAAFASAWPAGEVVQVSGRVVSAADGRPLRGAQVYVPGTSVGALSGVGGRYALNVPRRYTHSGRLTLAAMLIGYREARVVVPVPSAEAGDSVAVDFRLEQAAVALNALVVTEANAARGRAPAAAAPVLAAQMAGAPSGWYAPPKDREQYAHIAENDFRAVVDHPLSTFAIDVDPASYSNVRRFLLREHRLPPADAVRIEEMVNYFPYDYERPRGDAPVAVTTEVGAAPWAPRHRLLRIGLASRPIETRDLPPANLVFLLDVSGSMAMPDKLPLVQASMRLLVEQLRPVDRVAIVVYAGAAGLVLPPTPGDRKDEIMEAIDRLQAGGSTAGGAGLQLAYDVARRNYLPEGNNRVILATDGDFNVGESSDAAMVRLIENKREQGTFLTVLGFGTGNLQNEKMEQLAEHGNGNFAYIDGIEEARKVLVAQMGATLMTVARDVKVQVEFNPARVQSYRLIGYESRLLAPEDFNNDRKDAGELGAGHTVTALYELVPRGSGRDLETSRIDPLRYRTRGRTSDPSQGQELAFVKIRYKSPHGTKSRLLTHPVRAGSGEVSADFRFASAVAGFGMLLRQSEHRGSITAAQVMTLAREGLGEDPRGYRHGFLELVRTYERLTGEYAARDRR